MINNLKKLISFKTVSSDKKENKRALLWIKSQIPKKLKPKIVSYNGYYSLLAGSSSPTLCLQSHVDVVPGNEEEFKPQIKNNKLYGRGAYDMKFAIACYLQILKKINLEKHDIGLLITSDEEIGGFNGVKKVLEDGYSPKFCIIPDGEREWNIDKRAKGARHIKIISQGKSGHASRPWEGESAIHNLIDFLSELKKDFPSTKKEAFVSTVNVGKIEGGDAPNRIADSVEAKIDIRFTSHKEDQRINQKIKLLKKKFKKIKTEEIVFVPLFDCDLRDSFFQKFKKIAKENGRKITTKPSHASSDARYFSQKNIPTVVTRPKGGGAHSEKEWIDIKDLHIFCKVLEKFIKEITLQK